MRSKAGDGQADHAAAEQGGDADAEHGQGQAADDLVAAQLHGDESVHASCQHRGDESRQHADQQRTARLGAGKPGQGTDQHQPLDAEVDDPGALVDDRTEGGKQDRRAGTDRCVEQNLKHGAPPGPASAGC